MGSSPSSFSNVEATIQIKDGITFRISYADLVDHILLLRKVISHPEMTEQGAKLDYFIQDYCKRMAHQVMITVIRQHDFLEKFQKHDLYERSFKQQDLSYFEQLVQNYVLFLKLARENEMIVPTFDIDIIWHSHMRRPIHYRTVSKALCGFVLDHDDAIEQNILSNSYQKTAERWKQAYKTDYDHNIDRKNIEASRYVSSCAAVGSGCDSICVGGGGCGGDGEGDGGGCGEDCED
ncbi:unnamed protein product [Adineta steineri]|uniref:Uncharacterized protein n=1 Tax=Adineta steineri TaxID=433720 RepID=A0A819Z8E3_9BILA|nr:unnamed protein product [Adineta steineri]